MRVLRPSWLPVSLSSSVSGFVLKVVNAMKRVEEVLYVKIPDAVFDKRPDEAHPVSSRNEILDPLVDGLLLRCRQHATVKVHQLPVTSDVVFLIDDALELR